MSNISIKVNLQQLKHKESELTRQDGSKVKVLIIPIEENMLFKGEKGCYLNITAIEIKDRSKFSVDQKDTHLLKQDIPRDKYDLMSDEQKKLLPILGNAVYWGRKEAAPIQSESLSNEDLVSLTIDDDGLPF
jgi:hypothetical protein